MAELKTTVDDGKCIKELEEYKTATAMLMETLNHKIESVNIDLEEKYYELKGHFDQGQTELKTVSRNQAGNGKSQCILDTLMN